MRLTVTLLLLGLSLLAVACEGTEQPTDNVDEGEVPAAPTAEALPAPADDVVPPPVTPRFEPAPCPIATPDGAAVDCGFLVVPERHGVPDGRSLRLAVAIVRALDGASGAPVIYLAGGPGGSGLDDFVSDPASWDYPFTRTRDLILVDQRGTGYSQPTLDCPEFQTAGAQENPDRLCFERLLEAGIDVDAYNTRENAADIAALRLALDIDEWNLLGVSYGTRLALEVLRRHPEGVRSVILDSPFPPNADTPVDEVYGFTDALAQLFADCARDAYCRENYPDLENVLLTTVERLNADETAPIFGDDVVFALVSAFNDTELVPLIPWVIYEVAADRYEALDELASDEGADRRRRDVDQLDRSDSEGMYNSVICHDEYATGDYERVETAVVGTIPEPLEAALLQQTADVTRLCDFWNPKPVVDNTAVVSAVPALILVGQYDVATPPRWARLTAVTLSNAYLFEIPGAGHSLLSSVDCSVAISAAFLDDPGQVPDAACLAEIEWPFFE